MHQGAGHVTVSSPTRTGLWRRRLAGGMFLVTGAGLVVHLLVGLPLWLTVAGELLPAAAGLLDTGRAGAARCTASRSRCYWRPSCLACTRVGCTSRRTESSRRCRWSATWSTARYLVSCRAGCCAPGRRPDRGDWHGPADQAVVDPAAA